MVTISIAHPYYVSRYKIMVSNVILVKYHGCSDSEIHVYASVKYYSFSGSDVRPYVHTFVRPHEEPFTQKRQMVYSSTIPPLYNT